MYIHKLGNTTSGAGLRTTMRINKNHRVARNHTRSLGSNLIPDIFEGGRVQRKTDILRNLKLAQPKIPKKYISFDF